MKKILYTITLVFPIFVLGQSTNQNYVKNTVYKTGVTESETFIDQQGNTITLPNTIDTATDKVETITYYDGLGRPIQTNAYKGGGTAKDVITHIEYDAVGRQSKTYLPYTDDSTTGSNTLNYRIDPLVELNNYYTTNYGSDLDSNALNPYSEVQYESSPLNRVLQQAAPGKDWSMANNHTIKFGYQTNSVDEVRNFGVAFANPLNTEQPSLIYNGNYTANELYKTVTKDENWTVTDSLNKTTEEFKDKLGRVILKRTYNNNIKHDTQYVYDQFGNLTYVLSPKGSDTVLTLNQFNNFSNTIKASNFVTHLTKGSLPSGTTTVSLVGTTLTLNVNIQFPTAQFLKTGAVFQLSQMVPDVNFETGDTLNGYEFKIANGYLTVFHPQSLFATYPPSVSSLDGTFTVELSEYEIHQEEIDGLCYQYHYDKRNRLIEKKIPQKGWESIVYDNLDRPTLTQDKNLKNQNKWLFTKYDAFGRVAYAGIYKPETPQTRLQLQGVLNARTVNYESRRAAHMVNGVALYHTQKIFPILNTESDLLTINYYDDYNFDTIGTLQTGSILGQNITLQTKGLATGSKVRALGTTDWITTFTQYDKKAKPVYVYSKNAYLNTTDTVKTKYDFIGNVLQAETSHQKGGNSIINTIDNFTYDHVNRLLTQSQTINGATSELIVNNEYDDLGQLIQKNVGNNLTNPLQEVDYKYNIRGWLKQINDVNTNTDDLFSFKLNYNLIEGGLSNTTPVLYNGNIAQTIWKSASDNEKRSYAYNYDALNRINNAHTRMGSNLDTDMLFDLFGVNYDKNGNILNLDRNGLTSIIDDLDYSYQHNQLTKVTDGVLTNTEGFKDGTNLGDDYVYDDNGNMVSDANKQITSISYNHLNLPEEVKFNGLNTTKIDYIYDATGVKLKKVVTDGSNIITTQYAGNYVYKNDVLEFFNHPEGYVEPTDNLARPFQYVYQYKDHLGNIRVSYSDDDNDGVINTNYNDPAYEIRENKAYYPFGLTHKYGPTHALSVVSGRQHKYGYNGTEFHEELSLNWNDLGARNHDPALGRFMNLDPLAEDYFHQSPYTFAINNPVFFIDINGEGVETDYKILNKGKDKGKIVRADVNDGSEKNATDRILKTDRKGNVKTKTINNTDGTKSETAKVDVDNIAKGIIKEGDNLRTNDKLILIGGEGQPTLNDVVDFLVQLTDTGGGKEIAGYEGVHSRKESQKLIKTFAYKDNDFRTSSSTLLGLNQVNGSLKAKAHFHTHPSKTGVPGDIDNPSPDDNNGRALRNRVGNATMPSYIYNVNGRISY